MLRRQPSARAFFAVKALLFALCCAPLIGTAWELPQEADPVRLLTHESGENALRILLLTLAITPLRLLTGANWLLRLRRMLGLFAFAYALGHFSVYLFLDLQLDFSLLWDDVSERKYITVGFAALLLLIPLAATSNNWSVKKLGGKCWQKLHRAVYAIAPLAVLHFLWIKRGDDWNEPAFYGAVLFVLMAARLPAARRFLQRGQA